MTEEEIQALKTELDTTKTELESVRGELGAAQGERDTFKDSIAVFEQAVASKDTEIATLTAEKESLRVSIKAESQQIVTDLTDSYNLAVAAYKNAVGQANPAVPGELITGDTIEAIDNSLLGAKTLVDQVRTAIEAEIAAGRVPAGAPVRTEPDLSTLSPREKIQYAITKS